MDSPSGMKQAFCTAVLAMVCACSALGEGRVRSAYRSDLTRTVDVTVARALPDLLAYYKDLHAHPELSLHEERSAAKMAARLESAGYAVTTGVGGHGVVGVLVNGEGPTVLIRGDMDALPVVEETGLSYRSTATCPADDGHTVGVMHACGHDVHQTCLAGTAALLAETRSKWRGTVLIVAQPAEEIGRGAVMMIEDGLFDRFPRPDYCLALHVSASAPAGTVAYTSGWALANVDSVDVTVHGRGGHGSRPHEAIDPVVAAAQTVVALQTIVSRRVDPIESGVITVGSIHAGSKHNIIANDARLQITVRSYTDETRRILLDGIRDVTVNTCRAMGCTKDPEVVVRESEFTPATYNDPELTAASIEVLRRVLSPDRVREVDPVMGGEDFGQYGRQLEVPSFIFWLGAVEAKRFDASRVPGGAPLPAIHSSTFAPDPEPTITTGVRCTASLALALLKPAAE